MLTFILPFLGDIEDVNTTLSCIYNPSSETEEKISTIITTLKQHSKAEDTVSLNSAISSYAHDIHIINTLSDTVYESYHYALQTVSTDYVIFALPGDKFDIQSISSAIAYSNSNTSNFDVISFKTRYISAVTNTTLSPTKALASFQVESLENKPELVPTNVYGLMLRTASVRKYDWHLNLIYDAGTELIYQILNEQPYIVSSSNLIYYSAFVPESQKELFQEKMEYNWYFQSFREFLLPTLELYQNKHNRIPLFLQYAVLYHMKWRFLNNLNNGNKHVIDGSVDDFFDLASHVLDYIQTDVIYNKSKDSRFTLSYTLKLAFLHLKYGNQLNEKATIIYNQDSAFICIENILIQNLSKQKIYIDLIDFINNEIIIEASTDTFVGFDDISFIATFANEEIPIEETYRYAHTKFFGYSTHKRYTFRVKIPIYLVDANRSATFRVSMKYKSSLMPMTFVSTTYNGRVSSSVYRAYWFFGKKYLAYYTNKRKSLCIRATTIKGHIKKELYLLRTLLSQKNTWNPLAIRLMYWLTYPFMKKKTIWLTYDKLYKGGDCGEYLYRYMLSRNDGITPAYVLNGDCADYDRLKKEGLHPLKYGSLKHKLYYLYSSVVFTTHGGVHSFNAFDNQEVRYIQDLLHHDVACIQHGLTVQQLAFNSNRLFNNMKRYYCASKYEVQNLSHPVYGYEDKSVLKLTGIPRYDGLVNNDQKQILITPTWRNYIAMPASAKNNAKPYNPDFIHTDYFKIYNELLQDEKLLSVAKETGYKLIYLLHPVISAQINDYPKREGVEIVPALDINYEKILTESSLMITDYSGVQFDFAYMRKPIVYYHPPKLPPHYEEGGFFYDTMGFGEICETHENLVETICDYMRNNCEVKSYYREREDDFFAYNDLNSCQRIYDDMLELQRSK